MRRLLLVISSVALAACTTLGKRNTVSRWAAFDDVEDVSCAAWPIRAKDLRLDELRYVDGARPGFVVTGVRRDGGAMFYWAPFAGEEKLDAASFVDLTLGRGAVVAGGGVLTGRPYVALLQNAAKGATFEVRGVGDNVVKIKRELAARDIKDAWAVNADGGAWVTYRQEDNHVSALFLADRSKLAVTPIDGVRFGEPPLILPARGRSQAASFRREGGGVVARMLATEGKAGADMSVALAVEQDLESWTAGRDDGRYYVGYVDGDSLVGQAALKVSQVNLADSAASIAWTRSTPLLNVHAAEPVFVKANGAMNLLVMQWVDEESTIARYKVAGGQLGKPVYSGVFPKASRIMAAFTTEKAGDLFVVVRHKQEDELVYRICEL